MKRQIAVVLSILLLAGIVPAAAADLGWKGKVDESVLQKASSGTTDFIVYMRAKADLSAAERLPTKNAKGAFVYEALTSKAKASQAGLLDQLSAAGADYRSFWISNSVLVSGADLELLEAIARRDDVANIFSLGKGQLHEPVERNAALAPTSLTATNLVGPSLSLIHI